MFSKPPLTHITADSPHLHSGHSGPLLQKGTGPGPASLWNRLHSGKPIYLKLEPRELGWVSTPALLLHPVVVTTIYPPVQGSVAGQVPVRIGRETGSPPRINMKASVLWGKGEKALWDAIWPPHSLLWQEFILHDSDLWRGNTASAEVVTIHDGTPTCSDSSLGAIWETKLTALHSQKPWTLILKAMAPTGSCHLSAGSAEDTF